MALRLLALCCLLLATTISFSQKRGVRVGRIEFHGNQHTAANTMLRDMDFEVGDTISPHEFARRMARNRLFLMNLGLFSDVSIEVGAADSLGHCPVLVKVRERTRSTVQPIFELADRNPNVWLQKHRASLRYLDLGSWFFFKNFIGRNERLRVKMNWGYSSHYEAKYDMPGLFRNRVLGLEGQALWRRQREIGYRSVDNRLRLYFDEDKFNFDRRQFALTMRARPRLFWSYALRASWHDNRVVDVVASELNPDFFLNGKSRQRYFSTLLNVRHDLRDAKPYPLHGHFEELALERSGSRHGDLNLMTASFQTVLWRSFSRDLSAEIDLKGKVELTGSKIPYFNSPGLGYGRDYLHGYEFYVVDGARYARAKTSLRLKFDERTWDITPVMPIRSLQVWPVTAYLTLNSDVGYVRDRFYQAGNPLSNRPLWGGGIGIDLVAAYSLVGQVEWSINQRGEWGVFISTKTAL